VDMDVTKRKSWPSTAIAIVMDKSGSMSMVENGVEKIRLAGEGAIAVLELLRDNDGIAAIATDSEPTSILGGRAWCPPGGRPGARAFGPPGHRRTPTRPTLERVREARETLSGERKGTEDREIPERAWNRSPKPRRPLFSHRLCTTNRQFPRGPRGPRYGAGFSGLNPCHLAWQVNEIR